MNRHSRESGNPEKKINKKLFSVFVWIPDPSRDGQAGRE
jgi:hypothetical protein